MDQNKQASGDNAAVPKPGKKPYSKPEFRFERAFETMALSCGKVNPNIRQCFLNKKVS